MRKPEGLLPTTKPRDITSLVVLTSPCLQLRHRPLILLRKNHSPFAVLVFGRRYRRRFLQMCLLSPPQQVCRSFKLSLQLLLAPFRAYGMVFAEPILFRIASTKPM